MGTAEGAVGPASPRLSHPPCVLRPRAAPRADQPSLLLCPCTPAAATPQPQGSALPWGQDTRRERGKDKAVCRDTSPSPAGHWCISVSESGATAFYITDPMGFLALAYILMLQLSLAVSETSRPPSMFLLCVFFFMMEKKSNFLSPPGFSSGGWNKMSFIWERGFFGGMWDEWKGFVPTFTSSEQRICFIDYPLPVLKKVHVSPQPQSCLPACALHAMAEFPQKTWGCLSRLI